jgi:hypothetical protein
MEKKNTLDEINKPENINQAISHDEESEGSDRSEGIVSAEDLILQLPENHSGRNSWLQRFGHSATARSLRNAENSSEH